MTDKLVRGLYATPPQGIATLALRIRVDPRAPWPPPQRPPPATCPTDAPPLAREGALPSRPPLGQIGGRACAGARYPGVGPATQGTSRGLGHRARPPRAWPPPAAQPMVRSLEPMPRLRRREQSQGQRAHPKHRHDSPVLVPPATPRSGWTRPYRVTPRAPCGQQAEG